LFALLIFIGGIVDPHCLNFHFIIIFKFRHYNSSHLEKKNTCTVKLAHKVISIKKSPVLKGHLFLVLS
jgi:hypothetical protein